MTAVFRNAGIQDAEALQDIFTTSFCDTFAHLYRREDLDDFLSGFALEEWQRQLSDPAFRFRIAEAEGKPVGYLKLGPLKLPIEPTEPALLLDQLYIFKEHHGTGIAHALMDWALEQTRSEHARELYLTVYVDNHRAKRFYERYGFEPVGSYDFMVGSHADEDIIMRKVI